MEPAPVSGVEQAELNFADLAGEVLLRRDEHLGSVVDDDGMLRVEMQGWAVELALDAPPATRSTPGRGYGCGTPMGPPAPLR